MSTLQCPTRSQCRSVPQTIFSRISTRAGNPWELGRPIQHTVSFGGTASTSGWSPKWSVSARAYDCPIPGWKTDNCGNLRLWDALPSKELDLEAFNKGNYVDSVEARRKADAIVSVLYPNDATADGKLLRLQQQYFFVTASMQVRPCKGCVACKGCVQAAM